MLSFTFGSAGPMPNGDELLTFMVGIGKEIWNKYYGSGFCYFDVAANFQGILMAFSVYYFLFRI
jgi:hypothetical protein